MYSDFRYLLACCCVVLAFGSSTTQSLQGDNDTLKLVITESMLPSPRSVPSAVYDGDDTIFIVGGYAGAAGVRNQLVKYSLVSEEVTQVPTVPRLGGVALVTTNPDNIVYIGGGEGGGGVLSSITSISTRTGDADDIGNLTFPQRSMACAWDDNGVSYLFGGLRSAFVFFDKIFQYNSTTMAAEEVATLPEPRGDAAGAWDEQNQVAYIFGGVTDPFGDESKYEVLKFDPVTLHVSTWVARLPHKVEGACAVYADGLFYIVTSELIRFDPTTKEATIVPVEGWPVYMTSVSCAYVPKSRRIYIFGGWGRYDGEGLNNSYRDEIAYVQLETSEITDTPTPSEQPSTEPSICPPDGVHNLPYPGNCTLYIRCFHGEPHVLSCYPLRFDTQELICKPVADAYCDQEEAPTTVAPIAPTTSQPEPVPCPPIGYEVFPHESNCSKYYECNDGVAYESDCAPNTYFDINHEIRRCNQAELAACNAECPVFGIEFQPVRSRGCKWYKVCIEGFSTNLECGDGTLYNPEPQKCVLDQEYYCPHLFTV